MFGKFVLFFLVSLLSLASPTPIFQTNPLNLFQSTPQLAESHIEKIPPRKSARIEEQTEENIIPEEIPEEHPSFVEHKVQKLIHKLSTLSQLASIFRERLSEPEHIFEYTINEKDKEELEEEGLSLDEFFNNRRNIESNEEEINSKNVTNEIDIKRNNNTIRELFENPSKLISKPDDTNEVNSTIPEKEEEGFSIDLLNINNSMKKVHDENTDMDCEDSNMEDTRPYYLKVSNQIGVFVLELFASVVGLAVGTISQINHAFHQSNNTILEAIYNKTH